jgi:hypothetical protein
VLVASGIQALVSITQELRPEVGRGELVRDITLSGITKYFYPLLNVPRQCLLVILLELRLTEGRALGIEKVKFLVCGHFCEQRREVACDRI